MPEWRAGGRTAFFRPWATFYFTGGTSGVGLSWQRVLLISALLLSTLAISRKVVPPVAWVLLASSLGMWALAHATLFTLYLPSRYCTYALPAFALLWTAGAAILIQKVSARWLTMVLASVLFLSASMSVLRFTRAYTSPPLWSEPAGYASALDVIKALPTNTLIAAHPGDANAIPLRTRRSVLVNDEVSVAFNTVYYAEIKRRLNACFDMLYASDWNTIDTIADQFSVSTFLVDKARLWRPYERAYFKPFQAEIETRIAAADWHFAMLNVPAERIVYESGDVVLVRVGGRR